MTIPNLRNIPFSGYLVIVKRLKLRCFIKFTFLRDFVLKLRDFWQSGYEKKIWTSGNPALTSLHSAAARRRGRRPGGCGGAQRLFLFHGYSQPVTTHDSFNYYIAITILLVPVVALHYLWCQWTCLISAKMDIATRDLLKKWNLERYIDRFESKLTNLPSK